MIPGHNKAFFYCELLLYLCCLLLAICCFIEAVMFVIAVLFVSAVVYVADGRGFDPARALRPLESAFRFVNTTILNIFKFFLWWACR